MTALQFRLAGLASVVVFLLCWIAHSQAETVQSGKVRVSFSGRLAPSALPRHGSAPIAVSVGGRIATTDGSVPPQLRRIDIAVNRAARFDFAGLPVCAYRDIQPATTANALRACGAAKVGEGSFEAKVVIPSQSPFPSKGEVVAFNGLEGGRHVIFAHVYGTQPVPLSYTLVLRLAPAHGEFGTVLSADLPAVTSDVAYITGISLDLDRRFRHAGALHGFVSAGCPAPKGFPGATFPFARASFSFAGGQRLGKTLTRSCRALGR